MEMKNNIEVNLQCDLLVDLWRHFCEAHTELYELTCDEYMHLLSSDIEELNTTLEEKQKVLGFIDELNKERIKITNDLTTLINLESNPNKLALLITSLRSKNLKSTAAHIERLNLILLDIIEKTQDQNKKNQVFLNKAILSLKDLRESFNGKKSYTTYSASGTTKSGNTL